MADILPTFVKAKSSQMKEFFFDNFKNILFIRFNNGKEYKYRVTVSEYVDFVGAESQGKHFHKYIKNKEIKNTKTL